MLIVLSCSSGSSGPEREEKEKKEKRGYEIEEWCPFSVLSWNECFWQMSNDLIFIPSNRIYVLFTLRSDNVPRTRWIFKDNHILYNSIHVLTQFSLHFKFIFIYLIEKCPHNPNCICIASSIYKDTFSSFNKYINVWRQDLPQVNERYEIWFSCRFSCIFAHVK